MKKNQSSTLVIKAFCYVVLMMGILSVAGCHNGLFKKINEHDHPVHAVVFTGLQDYNHETDTTGTDKEFQEPRFIYLEGVPSREVIWTVADSVDRVLLSGLTFMEEVKDEPSALEEWLRIVFTRVSGQDQWILSDRVAAAPGTAIEVTLANDSTVTLPRDGTYWLEGGDSLKLRLRANANRPVYEYRIWINGEPVNYPPKIIP